MNKNNINIKNKLCKSLLYFSIVPVSGCSKLANMPNVKLGDRVESRQDWMKLRKHIISPITTDKTQREITNRIKSRTTRSVYMSVRPDDRVEHRASIKLNKHILNLITTDKTQREITNRIKSRTKLSTYSLAARLLLRKIEIEARRASNQVIKVRESSSEICFPSRLDEVATIVEAPISVNEIDQKVEEQNERLENKPISQISRLWMWLRNKGKRAN